MTLLTSPENRVTLSIPRTISQTIALYLIEEVVEFAMAPVGQQDYQVTVLRNIEQTLQAKINEQLESGLEDDDDKVAWFRYKGALISYTIWQPGQTSDYHYRYETREMEEPMAFDIRDLHTQEREEGDHRKAIKAAIDSGELHPGAPFLQEHTPEEWEFF